MSGSGALAFSSFGSISDNGMGYALTMNGPGTLILSTSNSYGGGTLIAAADGAIPGGTSLTLGAAATLILDLTQAVAGPIHQGSSIEPAAGGIVAVPEAGSLALLIAGLVVGLCVAWRRRTR